MTARLKTLLFSTLFPSSARPNHGVFVETRLRQLLATGEVETTVVAPVPWFPSSNVRFGGWAKFAATPKRETRNGVEVWHPRYPLPPKVGMSVAPLALALGARATLARLISDGFDFDLIDAHYYYPDGAAAALLARWFGKPFVVTARGSDLYVLPRYAIPRRWIRWTERSAAASITVSEALRQQLLQLGGDPNRVRLARNGIDLAAFRLEDRGAARSRLGLPHGRWIISVGNLIGAKGHHVAVEAIGALPQDVQLAIIGDGPDRARLEKLALDRGVAARVRLVGALPQAALVDWYNAADVLVLCSSSEGWPNVLLEALACGTRVVATAVGGIPEVVRSPVAGRLIAERNADVLAAAVLDVLRDSVSRSDVRSYASAFDWKETTDEQLTLFRAVVRSSTHQAFSSMGRGA
jgi:glycosyltransferase involved in cell wall biosynthesis